ncbi:MAG TPA: hypothetical protein VNO30_29880 [Kofleriaceae bacterium]|nr:hypothetical protein [Kofleriaceae bacterium]
MMVGVVVSGLLELGTASPSPVRRERRITYSGELRSETSLPERLATYVGYDATTSVPSAKTIRAEAGAVMNRLEIAALLPMREEAQALVDEMLAASRAARRAAGPAKQVIKRRVR